MQCVKDTLLDFGLDPKHGINGKIGSILLLHTWTQQMYDCPQAYPKPKQNPYFAILILTQHIDLQVLTKFKFLQ
jgi:hypothetical protein